ncbi:IclR family transcriptional regulator [Thioclava sp. FTW29]|uniref:IclR family transcriptional regulator n=1 Tax=Thioclava litoralis TaxID=3076557 RepID=A0ABZ1E4A1_9RHOB|nr:IclR family transcriptional regulator [Thioclava sp. FTW29]
MSDKDRVRDGQSISRAVFVLRVVADNPGASLGEIAKATGLARSTVQRLVAALHAEGLLAKTAGHQGVSLGMELARLGAKVQIDIRQLLRPLMEDLHREVGENIDLTLFDHGKAIVIEQLAAHEGIRVLSYVGREHPIHSSANGKAHLSQMGRESALARLGAAPERFTEHTLTDPQAILDQVGTQAQSGLFLDNEEFSEQTCAIAITLPVINGQNLALGVAMPKFRFERHAAAVKAALLLFRKRVQDAFGATV